MKQDLRELFKKTDLSEKKLPINHKDEFILKLTKKSFKKNRKRSFRYIANIAASFLILCMVSYIFFYQNSKSITKIANKTNIETQLKQIEKEYLANINKEWNNFLVLSNDQNLIKRFEQKLKDLDLDYQEISLRYKKETNNILVIEELIANLSTRLQLLKDIQEHIKFLNQASV
jgi:CHASE3 domain sensor protein